MNGIHEYKIVTEFLDACVCPDTTYCIHCNERLKKLDEHPEDHLPVLEIYQYVADSIWLHKKCARGFAESILPHA